MKSKENIKLVSIEKVMKESFEEKEIAEITEEITEEIEKEIEKE
jgi:hypothetical protein